ncbi:MAG: thioredoxin domain-containing protein [Deltaproteobacteria bacterium]|nr:thioredoxin domain-containing protein [Deltaproteobacteria bacterium]
MKTGYAVFGFVVVAALAFYVGYQAGRNSAGGGGAPTAAVDPGRAPTPPTLKREGEIFNLPVGENTHCKGPADAKVTIIEFSDFQCPFSARVSPTLEEIRRNFGNDVRTCFRHNPLPFHQDATLAAEAALAAGDQGKFWELHDKLFANQSALKRPDLERYAEELRLDSTRFNGALDQNAHASQIARDKADAAKFGARGTPAFFINGKLLSGAQPYDQFKAAVEEARKRADALLAKGVARDQLYTELVKHGLAQAQAPRPQPQPGEGSGRQLIQIGSADHCQGPVNAKVTIVAFSEFQCPFSGKVVPTVRQIRETYPQQVRICFKHNPLPFHQDAALASEAALAAGDQGKFWELHDKLFTNQSALKRPDLERYAGEIGLNLAKFKAALDNGTFKDRISEDMKLAAQVGARGTPTFFINGKKLAGAQPFESFKSEIDEEIKKANELLQKGVPPGQVYAELVKAEPFKPAAPSPTPTADRAPADDGKPVPVSFTGAFFKGPSSARVTIAEFSEFQCPFCKRVVPTLMQLFKEYPSQIRVAFKHNPLPFHSYALDASKAAIAAGKQGRFWEMHDKLFDAHGGNLTRADFERFAQDLQLNLGKFRSDLDSPEVAALIKADQDEAGRLGARGTPTFFINGRRLVGAQPIGQFKALIDDELKKK